jgi:hypothetical protein
LHEQGGGGLLRDVGHDRFDPVAAGPERVGGRFEFPGIEVA